MKNEKDKVSDGALLLSNLISTSDEEHAKIMADFHNDQKPNDVASFRVIRNMIAHGDPELTLEIVRPRYALLYNYLTRAIVKVLHIPNEQIATSDNYYDKLKAIASI